MTTKERIDLPNGMYITNSETDGVFLHWAGEDGRKFGQAFMSWDAAQAFVAAMSKDNSHIGVIEEMTKVMERLIKIEDDGAIITDCQFDYETWKSDDLQNVIEDMEKISVNARAYLNSQKGV